MMKMYFEAAISQHKMIFLVLTACVWVYEGGNINMKLK